MHIHIHMHIHIPIRIHILIHIHIHIHIHIRAGVHKTVETQTLPPTTEEREIQTDALDSKSLMLQMGKGMTAKVFA